MCISLSLAGLSNRVVFDLKAVKKPLESLKIPLTFISGL